MIAQILFYRKKNSLESLNCLQWFVCEKTSFQPFGFIDGLFAVIVKFATLMIYFQTRVTLPLASVRHNFIFQFE